VHEHVYVHVHENQTEIETENIKFPGSLVNLMQLLKSPATGVAKLNVPYTRRSDFSYAKAYKSYVERMKNHCNAVDGTFNDAINLIRPPVRPAAAPVSWNRYMAQCSG